MTEKKEVTKSDIFMHYIATTTLYLILLFAVMLCPAYYKNITNNQIDYSLILGFFFTGYLLFAPILLGIFKPESIKESRSLTIFSYIKRQFIRGLNLTDYLRNITPTEKEKQALTIVFMQVFFATYTAHILCETYLPNISYNFDFLWVMMNQAATDMAGLGVLAGLKQFIIDTGDIWLKIIFTITTLVYLVSYLSDTTLFKNKIKSVDTTPLGVLSCICSYYPITLLTYSFIRVTEENLLPVNNPNLLATLNIIVILANLGSLIAILRLGTKAGNLTNRGIVTGFPYNIIRHPDYSMQIIYIVATTVPLMLLADISLFNKIMMLLSTLAWIFIYYLRAITEERHLIQDPAYEEYTKKVKHRFIPKLF